ncbi:sensor histidine kinase [Leisingera methylohalidivorans]|uniref:C4-dicarboxylate transport sensor protein DctB n=1 Tax=Leisingera methylohalidivorans DSM 14336 TaxID=999552 RepID=V9VU52_9RHOB|nr:ATP-binding protein [Leisingera methylohalidivorans]AHD01244.1 C4-dicarboxylate ABC transporter [Leisingera methylohalidivorans DSM 14336]
MKTQNYLRWSLPAGFLLAVAALALAVWSYGYRQALDSLAERSAADLALASDRVSTQLQVYQELAVLTVEHPALRDLSAPDLRAQAAELLRSVADKTAALDVFFAAADGTVLAAAEGVAAAGVARQGYFTRAMQGALGTGHGVLQPGGKRAYFYAAPAFGADGRVRGALVVVADVADVEQTWRGSLPAVFFTNATGEVFIANRSELLFWQRVGAEPAAGKPQVTGKRLHAGHEIWSLRGSAYLPQQALHLSVQLPVIGMTGEILVDVAPARAIAALQAAALAAVCLAFGAMLFIVMERRRTLAEANAVLESRVEQRTKALSLANDRLRREVREREEAEAALKRAQEDLVQAGKLSALGQMSAGISHELNQPLMAIQQYAENGTAFLQRGKAERTGENLGRIADMAARMARIIKNLRAFARNESEPMGRVDLLQVIDTAVELTTPRLKADQVALRWDRGRHADPVLAWGGEVRLTQVFVNLINNAADAMQGQTEKMIAVSVETGPRLQVRVQDSGPGIREPEKMFDPFYSTKAVGSSEGMGLGLSISYGLVQSFGGNIRGTNTGGGAMFTVELEPWRGAEQKEDAA